MSGSGRLWLGMIVPRLAADWSLTRHPPAPPSLPRARLVLGLLKKEVELCKLQADIREQVGARGMEG